MTDLVSVLLPIYKEPIEWIKTSVESILNQTYDNIELLILVDQPERTDVTKWLYSKNDKRIRVVQNHENIGLVKNLNNGILRSSGRYIARMDADDISLKNRIEEQIEYLSSNNYDLIASDVIRMDNNGEIIGSSGRHKSCQVNTKYLKKLRYMPHPTWLGKRELFEELEGYRDIFSAEDYDFLIRAHILDFKIGFFGSPCLYYRQNLSGITQTNKGRQRVTSLVVREQLKNNKIYSTDEISDKLRHQGSTIEKYTAYYTYTRYVRNVIYRNEKPDIKRLIRFRLYFFRIALADILFQMGC